VRLIVNEYTAMYGGDPSGDAMVLAIGVDKIAGLVASEVYDPTLKPKIADELFSICGPKLKAHSRARRSPSRTRRSRWHAR